MNKDDKPSTTKTFRDTNGNERHTNMPNAQPRRGEKEVKKPEQKPNQPGATGRNKYAQ